MSSPVVLIKRELDPCLSDKDCKWSPWTHGLYPILNKDGAWYVRNEITLEYKQPKKGTPKEDIEVYEKDKLKTHCGGNYEIAAKYRNQGELIVVYVGRAQKIRKQSKGVTLRTRIYSNYCRDGSHLRYELEELLKHEFHIYFRWIELQTITECNETEMYLIKKYDYAFNTAGKTTPYRSPKEILHFSGTICWFDYIISQQTEEKEKQEITLTIETLLINTTKLTTIHKIEILNNIIHNLL